MAPLLFTETLHGEDAFQGFAVERTLYRGTTPFQRIEILQSRRFGRVLVLDGIVQTTEADEFMYHEMLVHVPMFSCENPRRVLIVGGGDGGALREALKHDVERVDMVEIDREVVDRCVEFLPGHNDSGGIYEDPRANLVIEDAFEYLADGKQRYDVIVSDSTDPVGAGEVLFSRRFYQLLHDSLNPGGAIALQNGVVFLQRDEPLQTMRELRAIGLRARCYVVAVPTYYGGNMTLAFATNDDRVLCPDPDTLAARFERAAIETSHYTPAHHSASFVLPRWIENITGEMQ